MLAFVPRDRLVNREDISFLTVEQIESIRAYFQIEFGYYEGCLSSVLDQILELFLTVDDGSVVLSPGDSPKKLIQVMKILYGTGNQYTMRVQNQVITKTIYIVEFPLSNARSLSPILIDTYLKNVLGQYPFHSKFYLFDIIRGGGTYSAIENSLRRITGDQTLRLPAVAINFAKHKSKHSPLLNRVYDFFLGSGLEEGDTGGTDDYDIIYTAHLEPCVDLEVMLDVAEDSNSRCVPSYNLESNVLTPLPNGSLFRCNIIVMRFVIYATTGI